MPNYNKSASAQAGWEWDAFGSKSVMNVPEQPKSYGRSTKVPPAKSEKKAGK